MMNKQYFIDIRYYQTHNKLDEKLQKSILDEFQHRLIKKDQLHLVKDRFEKVCQEYREAGGKAVMEYRDFVSLSSENSMRAEVGKGDRTSMYIDLVATRGNVL